MSQTVRLATDRQRALACDLIRRAPENAIVSIKPETRSGEQNNLLWQMLSDVSRSKPDGRKAVPEVWKALFMHACGHAVAFEMGLEGQPFPIGFRSSRLSKKQCSDLIDFIGAWGSERGVIWSDLPQA